MTADYAEVKPSDSGLSSEVGAHESFEATCGSGTVAQSDGRVGAYEMFVVIYSMSNSRYLDLNSRNIWIQIWIWKIVVIVF